MKRIFSLYEIYPTMIIIYSKDYSSFMSPNILSRYIKSNFTKQIYKKKIVYNLFTISINKNEMNIEFIDKR